MQKEFFQLIVRQLFDPMYGMVTQNADTRQCALTPTNSAAHTPHCPALGAHCASLRMVVILLPRTAVTRASYFAYDYHARTHTHTLMRFRYWFNADSLECNHEFELLGVIDASNRLPCAHSVLAQLRRPGRACPLARLRAERTPSRQRACDRKPRSPFLVSPGFSERL